MAKQITRKIKDKPVSVTVRLTAITRGGRHDHFSLAYGVCSVILI